MIPLFDELPPDFPGALCAQTDPELFFPEAGRRDMAINAKKVCADCEVRTACLEWAVETGQHHGIYGGLTPFERRGLRPVQRPVA